MLNGIANFWQKRKRFLFHLNKSGAYFELKEHLKEAVVEIVREVRRYLLNCTMTGMLELIFGMTCVEVPSKIAVCIKIRTSIVHKRGLCVFGGSDAYCHQ